MAVMTATYDGRRASSSLITLFGMEFSDFSRDTGAMLETKALLLRLREVGARNVDMARVLDLPDSRIPEIFSGKRQIKLDEAAKLVRYYKLGEPAESEVSPVPLPIARLVVHYVGQALGVAPSPEQVEELGKDLQAFSAFLADPETRESTQAATGFFDSIRIRRRVEQAAPPAKHPRKNH